MNYNICFYGVWCILLLVAMGCGKTNPLLNTADKTDSVIDLNQNITINSKAKDSIFIHFEKNWKSFINNDKRLLQSVLPAQTNAELKPLVSTDCVFSAGAGAFMPRVNISWTEQEDIGDENIRFDISLLYKGFERNMYTTIYPVQNLQRFKMPGNSRFIQDTTALFLTGSSIFPKFVNVKKELINSQTPAGNTQIQNNDNVRHNLVIEDLGPGLSYTLRKCRFDGKNWTETLSLIFTTPVCPQKF